MTEPPDEPPAESPDRPDRPDPLDDLGGLPPDVPPSWTAGVRAEATAARRPPVEVTVTELPPADRDRVIKLLLATLLDGDEPPVVAVDRDDMSVAWTDRELAEADDYRLEVTARPGGRPALELRLVREAYP